MRNVSDENNVDVMELATKIAITTGICQVLIVGDEPQALLRALWLAGFDAKGHELQSPVTEPAFVLPFADESFDAVISIGGIERFTGAELPGVFAEIQRVTRRAMILHVDTSRVREDALTSRRGWESACFEEGFRKHPLYYRSNDYASLENDGTRIFIPLEKLPASSTERYPMAALREERDLHMDMLRESGSRSDAHVGRYNFAARFIRPGDAVLDAACGLGYGTYVVRSETKARTLIGIDASEYGVDYARLNFGGERTEFRQGFLPDCLASIPDNSIDHVLCFETLEHVTDPLSVLAEFKRILTPGGRLSCSVPHDWSDETGEDPNPFHFHVYHKARFIDELSQFFDIECLVGQTADRIKQPGGGCVWLKRPRSLAEIPLEQESVEAEWLLAVAAKSPLDGAQVPYEEHAFTPEEQEVAGNALAFARDYGNPWLVRALISIGLRTHNAALRERWAKAVWIDHTGSAVDRGAALCVLAYAALARGADPRDDRLCIDIQSYLAELSEAEEPTLLRWRVSLMYVGGLLALVRGRQDDAHQYFASVAAAPVAQYSPTLLTKPAEAAYLLGLMLAGQGRHADARRTWWEAFQCISTSLGERLVRGYPVLPPGFEIRELATALALCGRLVAAAANGEAQAQRPAIFYDESHADSVFQLQRLAAVDDMLAKLRKDFLEQHSGLDALEHGKDWLEQQWQATQDLVQAQHRETEVLLSGKDWLERQWNALRQEVDAKDQQLEALLTGKRWIEQQWQTLQEQVKAKDQQIEAIWSGKQWIEQQWQSLQEQVSAKDQQIEAIWSGKQWIEQQWESLQDQASAKDQQIEILLTGKDWIEQQWKSLQELVRVQTGKIEALTADNARLEQQCHVSEAQAQAQAQELAAVMSRKAGIKLQWEATQAQVRSNQEELAALLEGKDWLEKQWIAMQELLRTKDLELEVILSGKNWLESQWQAQAVELNRRQQQLVAQQSQIEELESNLALTAVRVNQLDAEKARLATDLAGARDVADRLRSSRLFRLARKVGLFSYF